MAWTPAEITTELWLDAADSSTITQDGSGNVSQWDDKSGNARHAVQATSSLQPAAQTVDGLAAMVTGDGFLRVPGSTATFKFLHTTGGEVWVVFQVPNAANLPIVLGNNRASTGAAGVFFGVDSRNISAGLAPALNASITRGIAGDGNASCVYDDGANRFYPVWQNVIEYDVSSLWGMRFSPQVADADRMTLDKFARGFEGNATGGFPFADVDAGHDLEIGAAGNGVQLGSCTLREIIVINGQLSDNDRTLMTTYLARKWQLTDKLLPYHPGATTPAPASQTASVSGVIKVNGSLESRVVRAFSYGTESHTIDGQLRGVSRSLGQANSDSQTGEYSIDLLDGYGKQVFVVAFDDYGDDFAPGASVVPGDRIHPTVPNGYVYECSGAGDLPSTEPTWSTDTGTDQLVGTASFTPTAFYQPMVHGPIAPHVIAVSTDQFFDSVSLLLHMDGEDQSTVFPDSSSNSVPVAVGGGAQVTASKAKFGGALLLNGSDSYLKVTNPVIPAQADFTFEFFVAISQDSVQRFLFGIGETEVGRLLVTQNPAALDQIRLFIATGGTNIVIDTESLTLNQFYHVAITRSGDQFDVWLEGVNQGSATSAVSIYQGNFYIGRRAGGNPDYFAGYLDELRSTSGVARYNSGFIPPANPFPNTAG